MSDFKAACAYAVSRGWLIVQDDGLTLTHGKPNGDEPLVGLIISHPHDGRKAERTSSTVSNCSTGSAPPGLRWRRWTAAGPTYHGHSREDETFYVVSGNAEVQIENEIFLCNAGDLVYGPRNIFPIEMSVTPPRTRPLASSKVLWIRQRCSKRGRIRAKSAECY
jgi:mannose-6-phosphate isomerase-like protein (cupin superfamily)